VGAASSHNYLYLPMPNRVNRGWKPLPQSIALNLTYLGFFLGLQKIFFSIKLTVFWPAAALTPDT
jgi:hypothetical protein